MTQSGQGNEPQLPAVREGVVLPAQGDQWPTTEPSEPTPPSGQQHGAPAGGQAWGQPWGPQDAPVPSEPAAPAAPSAPAGPPAGAGPLPPEGAPYGQPGQSFGPPPQGPDQSFGAPQGWASQQPLPQQQSPEQHQPPAYQPPQPQQQPPAYQQPQQPPAYQQPQQPPAYGQPQPPQQPPAYQQPHAQSQPLPDRQPQPEPYAGAADETQMLPPQPAGDAEATQYIPPVPGAGQAAPQPPQQPSASAPLPPENQPAKAEAPGESTTQLRTVRPGRGAHRSRGQQPAPAAPASAAEETAVLPSPVPAAAPPQAAPSRRARQQQQQQQPPKPTGSPFAIRPGRPGDRPPPSEFDGLFRADDGAAGAGAGSPGETQQLPQFTAPAPADSGGGHGGRAGRAGRRRRMSPAVLIGIVIAGCGIAGLAAGAALSSGGDDEKKDDNTTLGSSDPSATEEEPTKAADPAEPQAKSLDALLKDSNNSRSAVINAVNNIKSCKALPKAASDLRTAARQRNDLVTRLGKLTVDKLPNQAQLTASLTKAWKSSAQADNQYAAWADQTRGKKGCHKGQARRTGRVGAAERASGEATAAKRKAAELWNPLAGKYGLTKHEATQL